ncbi:MAG: radical SAM/SPASM domain-containing protein [Sedimentitalea sp.]
MSTIRMPDEHTLNVRLSEVELAMGRARLKAMPRNLGVVVGNGCNIDCPHCYQLKNGDNLFRDADIGFHLRREIATLYPYLSTLRIQGGEVFALRGFSELVDDVAASVERPLISISTNATMINAKWAERIVSMPFQHMTVSMDAARPQTYARVRRGGDFDTVVENVSRIRALKEERRSPYPTMDSFFVIMRSNFREIVEYLDVMHQVGIDRISFQTMLVDARNREREPDIDWEVINTEAEVHELHSLLRVALERAQDLGQTLAWSGLNTLFEEYGLDAAFLNEENATLMPDLDQSPSAAQRAAFDWPQFETTDVPPLPDDIAVNGVNPEICSNPWYTMFLTENGDVSICFLSKPVGNLFETPLVEIWNSPAAVAKRARMLAGRVTESGCSSLWCDWRNGCSAKEPTGDTHRALLSTFKTLVDRLKNSDISGAQETDTKLRNVRRLLSEKTHRIAELEANLSLLWDDNAQLHEAGGQYIANLETEVAELKRQIAATP